jgi:hypothetical protein
VVTCLCKFFFKLVEFLDIYMVCFSLVLVLVCYGKLFYVLV